MFTIGQLARRLTGGNEPAVRKLLNDVGADFDEHGIDSQERVDREVVIDLMAIRAGDRIGRICAELLADSQREMALAELAKEFNIPHSTLRQAAWSGRLEARKSGRTWLSTPAAVEGFLKRRWQK